MKLCNKKNYFTLIETLIALFLTSMIITLIFSFFKEISLFNQQTEKKQQESFHYRYVDSRLNEIFQRLNPTQSLIEKKYFYFYLDTAVKNYSKLPSLVFTFNNGVKLDPDYSGYVLARLYLNDVTQQLCLVTWPLNKNISPNEKMIKEVLMNQVTSLEFKFYSAPAIKQNSRDIVVNSVGPKKEVPLKNKWYHQEWPATFEKIPSLIKIVLKIEKDEKGEEEEFMLSFVLPSKLDPIHYPPNTL